MSTTNTSMMIQINLKKDETTVEIAEGSTALDLASKLNLTNPNQACGVVVNGKTCDLTTPLADGDQVAFWSFDDREGKEIFWHTSAHVLAQAVLRLYPEAQPTIGPSIENGFYYDFANLTITDKDFAVIEKEMKAVIKENHKPYREVFANKAEALKAFSGNSYKEELISELEEGTEITSYKQGEFFDLCRGPHLPQLSKIKALKVLKTSGAYWRGDSSKTMLTRIYAISFPDRTELKEYLERLAEAKKRDHRIIGQKLGLFGLWEEAPGTPFIYPMGMIIWNKLLEYWRDVHQKAGYLEIKTPTMMTKELWEKSGHWKNYREHMFTSIIEDRELAIKPMNCPGGMLHYKSQLHSYRELPLRVAEIGHVHRYEPSGSLSGLFRVRSFYQDDAHIYMRPTHIEEEIVRVLELADAIYSTFELEYHLELSTRPEKDTIGSDEEWEQATTALHNALKRWGKEFRINEGDGAFYGPKIDFHVRDAIGRTWQCGTIQLDMALPRRFELEYTEQDGSRQRPVMIHRALYGSIERFFGILIEHYAGRFPLWLSPRQVRILTVADRHHEYARELCTRIREAGFLCKVDESGESVSKQVRAAQLNQVNYILTVGDQEMEHGTAALRTRDNVVHGEVDIADFLTKIEEERTTKASTSPYSKRD